MDNRDSKTRQENSNERARKDMAEFKAKLNERILAEKGIDKIAIKSGMTEIKPRENKSKEQNNTKTEPIKSDKIREEKVKINRTRSEGAREERVKVNRTRPEGAREERVKVNRTRPEGAREERLKVNRAISSEDKEDRLIVERKKAEKNREDKKKLEDNEKMSKADKQAKVEERARKRLENMARIDERARKEAEEKLVESVTHEIKEDKSTKNQRKITKHSQGDTSSRKRMQSTKKVADEKGARVNNQEHSKVTDIKEVKKAALENEKKRRKEAREAHIRHRIEQLKTTKAKVVIASFVFVVAFLTFVSVTIINDIEIDEGKHYTEEQIKGLVIKNVFDYNSVYLFLKYRYSEHEAIPFVEYIDVSWVNKNAVKIKVYDKNIIGCTNFMNEYVYFDKDGLVVETSMKREKDIPYITGIEFEELTLNSKIKVADEDIFEVILTVTQQISKYKLDVQEINFDKDYNLTLHSGDITVLLGKQLTYDEQLAKLQSMLREAKKEKLSGVLHMEKYKEGQDRIIFDKNN